jgi:hypothetical protein
VKIPVEGIAYLALVLFMLALRFADLDTVPMSEGEASQALTAWMLVYDPLNPEARISANPLTFWGQVMGFGMVGKGEFAARVVTAVAGVVLALLPLLFRRRLGSARTFLLALTWGLAASPFAASRTSDPYIWTAIFGVLALWALWNYVEKRRMRDAIGALVFGAVLVLLSGTGGLIVGVILLVALAVCAYWCARVAPIEWDRPSEEVLAMLGDMLRGLPVTASLITAGGLVVLVATGVMLYPAGLSMVAEALIAGIRGIWTPVAMDAPLFYPLLAVLLYDFGLVVLAALGFVMLRRDHLLQVDDRMAWVLAIVTALAALLYRGAGPGLALFIVLPLGWLVSHVVVELLRELDVIPFWDLVQGREVEAVSQYAWVKWFIAILAASALVMLGTHLQEVGRSLLTFAPEEAVFDNVARLLQPGMENGLRSLVWVVMSGLFLTVGCFLLASLWGNTATLQGLGLGFFGFVLVSGVGGGWNAVVAGAAERGEIWQSSVTLHDANWLRATLVDVSNRNTRTHPTTPITVVTDEIVGLTPHGLVAWTLRDFADVRFVSSAAEAAREPIVLMRDPGETLPDLGGSYVGQRFRIREFRSIEGTAATDLLAWLAQRRTRSFVPLATDVVLWLRLDVYNAAPIDFQAP